MSDSVLKQELPTLEDGKPKDFVLARHPEASCFQTNTFWPGQGERKGVWIVTRRMIDSMSYASGATEEEAWYRVANRTLAECYRESMAESAALRAEIANLTLLSDSQLANQERLVGEKWFEIKEGCEMPSEGDNAIVIVVDDNTSIGGERYVYQDVWEYCPRHQYWKGIELGLRQYVTHWKPLDWPALLAPKDTPTEPKSAPEEQKRP